MKTCPYCMGEIPDQAKKCKHCGEWVVDTDNPFRDEKKKVKKTKEEELDIDEELDDDLDDDIDDELEKEDNEENNVNNELGDEDELDDELEDENVNNYKDDYASRWRRFAAWISDVCVMYTIIGGFINYFLILKYKTTIGFKLTGVKLAPIKQSEGIKFNYIRRFLLYAPVTVSFVFYLSLLLTYLGISDITTTLGAFIMLLGPINIIELFFKTPTFVDKLGGVVRLKDVKNRSVGLTILYYILILIFRIIAGFFEEEVVDKHNSDVLKELNSDLISGNFSDDYNRIPTNKEQEETLEKMDEIFDKYDLDFDNYNIILDVEDFTNKYSVDKALSDSKKLKTNIDGFLEDLDELFDKLGYKDQTEKYSNGELLKKIQYLYGKENEYLDAHINKLTFLLSVQNEISVKDGTVYFDADAPDGDLEKYNKLIGVEYDALEAFLNAEDEVDTYGKERGTYHS